MNRIIEWGVGILTTLQSGADPQLVLSGAMSSNDVVVRQEITAVYSVCGGADDRHPLTLIRGEGAERSDVTYPLFGPVCIEKLLSISEKPFALKELVLQGAVLTWRDLSRFKNFTNLESINLDGAILERVVGVHDARAVTFHEGIRILSMNNVWVVDKNRTELQEQLFQKVFGNKQGIEAQPDIHRIFHNFRFMPNLEAFSCAGNSNLVGEISFDNVPNLKTLNLSGTGGVYINGPLPALQKFSYDYFPSRSMGVKSHGPLTFSENAALECAHVRWYRNPLRHLGFEVRDRQVRLYHLDDEYAQLVHPILCAYKNTDQPFEFMRGEENNPHVLFTIFKEGKRFTLGDVSINPDDQERLDAYQAFIQKLNQISSAPSLEEVSLA